MYIVYCIFSVSLPPSETFVTKGEELTFKFNIQRIEGNDNKPELKFKNEDAEEVSVLKT